MVGLNMVNAPEKGLGPAKLADCIDCGNYTPLSRVT